MGDEDKMKETINGRRQKNNAKVKNASKVTLEQVDELMWPVSQIKWEWGLVGKAVRGLHGQKIIDMPPHQSCHTVQDLHKEEKRDKYAT